MLFAGNFGDNMVLQRSQKSAVYGTATPGANVQLVFAQPSSGFSFSETVGVASSPAAEHHGTWKVLLPPRPAGNNYTLTATCAGCPNTTAAVASGIATGEVWLVNTTSCKRLLVFSLGHVPHHADGMRCAPVLRPVQHGGPG